MLRRVDCMKLLYIAQERRAAELAARALRVIAPGVRLTWTSSPTAAVQWIGDNRDARAVLVDAGAEFVRSDALLEQVRQLGLDAPVAVVSPEHLEHVAASLASRLAERQATHDVALARTNRICTALQEQLFELEGAVRRADEREAAHAATTRQLAQRETELSAALGAAAAVRAELEHRLADAETARQHALQHAASELTAADERCAALDGRLTRETAVRTALEERIAAAELARADLDRQHAAELSSLNLRLADREAQHTASLARTNRICTALQERLIELEGAVHVLDERRLADAAAAEQRALREQELETSLAEAAAARGVLERRLADGDAAQQRTAADLAVAAQRCVTLEEQLTRDATARAILEQRLAAAHEARREADRHHATEMASLTARVAEIQAGHDAAVARASSLEQQLSAAERSREHAVREHTSERATWTARLADLEARHDAEAARARDREADLSASLTAALAARAALEGQVLSGGHEVARLQQELDALRRQLTAMRTRADALRRHASQIGVLQLQLEKSHKDNRRQFERAPYGLCECTRAGIVTRVNHSLAHLLGYATTVELQRVDFSADVLENPADLQWLIERAAQTGKPEAIDTTLKTRDGRRLFVRLHAQTRDDSLTVAVEDQTRLSAIEQRLREAQRLEAVGRVASEVAVTCDTLLRDVSQGGRQWLAGFERDTRLRQQGELLLGDVTRAAGFLRQFVAYGHRQINSVEPISLSHLLREMAPVLKRVLGDEIGLVLPKTTDRFEVDVDSERVERILVNVANYARERMPHGGRVKVQLRTTVVDHRFLANHPQMRPGAHVVLTITEVQGPIWPAWPIPRPAARSSHAEPPPPLSEKPGIDLGPLVALISDVGGHLWMSAEPAGNLTIEIRLPQRTSDGVVEPASSSSGRSPRARWFRN